MVAAVPYVAILNHLCKVMKKIPFTIWMVLCLPAVFSCQNEEQERENLRTEVIDIRDEAMSRKGTLVKLQKQLTQVADSLRSDSVLENDVDISDYEIRILQIKTVDRAMEEWVNHYNEAGTDSSMEHEEAMEFLRQEREKMSTISKAMEEAISEGESMMNR